MKNELKRAKMNAKRFEIEDANLTVDVINALINMRQNNVQRVRTFSLQAVTADGRAYEYATIEGADCFECKRRRFFRLAGDHLTINCLFARRDIPLADIAALKFTFVPGKTAARS